MNARGARHGRLAGGLALTLVAGAAAMGLRQSAPPAPIVLDGAFDDWQASGIFRIVDPEDAPADAEVDLGEIAAVADTRSLHLGIELRRLVNAQVLDGRLDVLLDADGDLTTGRAVDGLMGVDLVVSFTPPGEDGRSGRGVGTKLIGATPADDADAVSPYAFGVAFAPTHASRRIEVRIERWRPGLDRRPLLAGVGTTVKLVARNAEGRVYDETLPLSVRLPARVEAAVPVAAAEDPLARGRADVCRIVSWNTRYGALLKDRARARRILAALDADVVLLQEQDEGTTAAQIVGLLNETIAPTDRRGRWTAVVGAGGGNLRSAVATRLPLARRRDVEPIGYPDQEGRYLRTAAASVTWEERTLGVLSAHLKCCGRLGDSSDQKRSREAEAINAALRDANGFDAIIVAGDMNLVGGAGPLEILARALDADGSPLDVAPAMQLDGRSNATWADPEQPFVPGRLDYVLVSGTMLEIVKTFVLDTEDLHETWLEAHALRADDTGSVSDHLPVVVDVALKE